MKRIFDRADFGCRVDGEADFGRACAALIRRLRRLTQIKKMRDVITIHRLRRLRRLTQIKKMRDVITIHRLRRLRRLTQIKKMREERTYRIIGKGVRVLDV